MPDELKWGQTHWDDMSREELLREVQRMYIVIQSLYSVVKMRRHFELGRDPNNLYWGKEGVGGIAAEMARQVLEPIQVKYDESDPMFSGFSRYARDLLFDLSDYPEIGYGWVVCPECGTMLGTNNHDLLGEPCHMGKPGCSGVFRKLEWSDLESRHDKGNSIPTAQ